MGSIRRQTRKMINERGAGCGEGEWQEKISRRDVKSSMGERACFHQVSHNPNWLVVIAVVARWMFRYCNVLLYMICSLKGISGDNLSGKGPLAFFSRDTSSALKTKGWKFPKKIPLLPWSIWDLNFSPVIPVCCLLSLKTPQTCVLSSPLDGQEKLLSCVPMNLCWDLVLGLGSWRGVLALMTELVGELSWPAREIWVLVLFLVEYEEYHVHLREGFPLRGRKGALRSSCFEFSTKNDFKCTFCNAWLYLFLKKAALLNLVLSVQTNMNYFTSSSVFSVTHK